MAVFIRPLNEYARHVSMPTQRGEPARQASLREHNLALVLRELADGGPASRARLAASTGLTKGTVSSIVEALLEARLVAELGAAPVARAIGRPGQSLGLNPAGPVGVGLEINVDYLATCTVDLTGAVLHRQIVAADFRGQHVATVLTRAAHAVRQALEAAAAAGSDVAGLAVAVPGLVETGAAILRLAPNLGWLDVPVLTALREHPVLADAASGLPMRLDNEANLAALGELWCGGQLWCSGELSGGGELWRRGPVGGAAEGPQPSFIHISGEVGVGAGVVVDGQLYRGRRGFSGEVGHLPVAPTGPRCACGARGCLEQVAGQEAILRQAGIPAAFVSTLTGRPEGSVDELVGRARSGDAQALSAIADAGHCLGIGIAALVNLLDLDTVVLGGLYAVLAPWLRRSVEEELAARVLATPWAPVRLLVSRLGGEAAVRGAATSVLREVLADPAAYLARVATTG